MKKNYKGHIELENFGQFRSFVSFKMATEDWSAYRLMSIIAINWIFLQNGLTKIYKLGLEMKSIYRIRKFWPISKFCCRQNGHRRLVGLMACVYNGNKLNLFSKTA